MQQYRGGCGPKAEQQATLVRRFRSTKKNPAAAGTVPTLRIAHFGGAGIRAGPGLNSIRVVRPIGQRVYRELPHLSIAIMSTPPTVRVAMPATVVPGRVCWDDYASGESP